MKKEIHYLEGLRGLGATTVVLCHFRNLCFLEDQENLLHFINQNTTGLLTIFLECMVNLLVDGSLYVWIFWLMSAYVISIVFFKINENYDKIVLAYFTKRYFRLMPPVLGSTLLAFVLLKLGLMYNQELATILGKECAQDWVRSFYNFEISFWNALKSGFWNAFFNHNNADSYNPVLWTIYKEFLGSLFTFSLFGIVRHNPKRFILYFLILGVLIALHTWWLCAFVVGHMLCDYDFSSTPSEIPLSKILLKIKEIEKKVLKYPIFLLIVSLVVVIFGRYTLWIISPKLPADLILGTFVMICVTRMKIYQQFFSWKVFLWIGKYSFAIYLLHMPVLNSLTSFIIYSEPTTAMKIFACALTYVVVVLISIPYTYFIDNNSIILGNKMAEFFRDKN